MGASSTDIIESIERVEDLNLLFRGRWTVEGFHWDWFVPKRCPSMSEAKCILRHGDAEGMYHFQHWVGDFRCAHCGLRSPERLEGVRVTSGVGRGLCAIICPRCLCVVEFYYGLGSRHPAKTKALAPAKDQAATETDERTARARLKNARNLATPESARIASPCVLRLAGVCGCQDTTETCSPAVSPAPLRDTGVSVVCALERVAIGG